MWQVNDTSITVTGRTYPLELFFAQLGFDKEGDAWIFLPTAEKTIQNVHQDLNRVAATWGWHIQAVPAA